MTIPEGAVPQATPPMDPKLPAATGVLLAVLEKIRDKCRPGYMVSKFVVDWITEATAIATAVNASLAASAAQAVPVAPSEPPKGFAFVSRNDLRNLVDHVWSTAFESEQVPSTDHADRMIDHTLGDDTVPPFPEDIVTYNERRAYLRGVETAIGTLTIAKFRGHLENTQFDYTGSLPDGSYQVYASPPKGATQDAGKDEGIDGNNFLGTGKSLDEWRATLATQDSPQEALNARSPWQPIETAPKDGRTLLLCWTGDPAADKKAPPTAICGQISVLSDGEYWDGSGYRPIAWVTHWMPLPEPPSAILGTSGRAGTPQGGTQP